jgi:hypothetical protein
MLSVSRLIGGGGGDDDNTGVLGNYFVHIF